MLPGLRFVLAAVVLTMSLMVFGLGAMSLLRASHAQFARLPADRSAPPPALLSAAEPSVPMLASLSLDPAPDAGATAETKSGDMLETSAAIANAPDEKAGDAAGAPSADRASETPQVQDDGPKPAGAPEKTAVVIPEDAVAAGPETIATAAIPARDEAKPPSNAPVTVETAALGDAPQAAEPSPPAKPAIHKRVRARAAVKKRKRAARAAPAQTGFAQPGGNGFGGNSVMPR